MRQLMEPSKLTAVIAIVAINIASKAAIGDEPRVALGLVNPSGAAGAQASMQPGLMGDFDANNDGLPDSLVISPVDEDTGLQRVLVLSLSTDSVLHEFVAEQSGDFFGPAIASAGDVNADGSDDIAIPVFRPEMSMGATASFVDVRSGATGALLHRLTSDQSFDNFGSSIAAVGDVDNDGSDDLLIGAPKHGSNNSGNAFLFSGATGNLIRQHRPGATEMFYGAGVAGLGDINADGVPEYAISGPSNTSKGLVRIYSGGVGPWIREFEANTPGGYFGMSICSVQDLTNDGASEIAVAEPEVITGVDANGAPVRKGRISIFDSTDGSLELTLEGANGRIFGLILTNTGSDPDLDGWENLVVGTGSLAAPGDMDSRSVQFRSGQSFGLLEEILISDALNSPAAIADVNIDGRVDIDDIESFLRSWDALATDGGRFDLDGDGFVDVSDLLFIMSNISDPTIEASLGFCSDWAAGIGAVYALGWLGCGLLVFFTSGLAIPCLGWLLSNQVTFGLTAITLIPCGACIAIDTLFPGHCP